MIDGILPVMSMSHLKDVSYINLFIYCQQNVVGIVCVVCVRACV